MTRSMLWASIAYAVARTDIAWVQAAALLVASAVTAYLARLPTLRKAG